MFYGNRNGKLGWYRVCYVEYKMCERIEVNVNVVSNIWIWIG